MQLSLKEPLRLIVSIKGSPGKNRLWSEEGPATPAGLTKQTVGQGEYNVQEGRLARLARLLSKVIRL